MVLGTIHKLSEVKENLQIKRKFKKLTGNKTLWWFVVHCQEEILCKLDTNWEKVNLQTGWTLQKCYMPANCNNEQLSPQSNINVQPQSATPCASSQPDHQLSSQPVQQSDCNSSTVSEDELATKPESNETSSSTITPTDTHVNQEEPSSPTRVADPSNPSIHFLDKESPRQVPPQ